MRTTNRSRVPTWHAPRKHERTKGRAATLGPNKETSVPRKFQNSSSQVHKDNHFQRVPKVWQLFPRTSTSFQVEFKLHGQQFQNNNKNQEQVMILSCWDISFDQRSSQSHNSYIIGSYKYLSTKRPTTKQRTETKQECRSVHWVHKCPTSYKWHQNSNNFWNWWHRNAKTVKWTSVQLQNWHLQKPCSTLRRLSAVTYQWIPDRFQTA